MQSSPSDAYPARLLDDYLTVSRRREAGALSTTALRTGSVSARRILARAASRQASLEELLAAARDAGPGPADLGVAALVELAGVTALQDRLPDDCRDGAALYDLALRRGGPGKIPSRHQGIHAQLTWRLGDRAKTAQLLKTYRQMPGLVATSLRLDLANPFVERSEANQKHSFEGADGSDVAGWLNSFGELLASPRPRLSDDLEAAPFDRVYAVAEAKVDAPEKISVVVTAFKPDECLVTSVRSLLAQSWTNLEILIVDDGSPSEHDAVLQRCVDLDKRVRLIKMETNGGTYRARNAAFDAASGDFVTFQDSDDWAHPARLERQVRPLLDNPDLVATVSDALGVDDQLTVTRPGRLLKLLCTPSLMFRRERVLPRLGYLDSIRKAADTEFLKRIGAVFGEKSVLRLREVYTLMRQSPDSLSRAEFRSGWRHPARYAYQCAYKPWHDRIAAGEATPYLDKDPATRPFAAPARYTGRTGRSFDVVLACDWRPFGGPQKSMLEEIAALTRRGKRVAVLHLESYRHMTTVPKPLCAPIQKLINDGAVDQVLPDDDVDVSLLVLRYPPVLQYRGGERLGFTPRRAVVLANQAPSEIDGTDLRYVPASCHDNARELFGVEPLWTPQGPMVRAALVDELQPEQLADFDLPGIIDVGEMLPREGFRSDIPVLGRHTRDDWTKWPADRRALLQLYPRSPEVDVRIMGGAKSARALLGGGELPSNWIVYRPDELDVDNFLRQIDFYVYFPHPKMIEAFGRAVVEALAAGCVAFLPQRFEETFGDAAIYCLPDEVPGLVDDYYRDPELYLAQSRLAQQRVRENFSHDSYLAQISALLPSAERLKGPAS